MAVALSRLEGTNWNLMVVEIPCEVSVTYFVFAEGC